ncbi:MAG: glycosyltransferase family 4 protein [Alphaproteobacteria bacterium]
MTSDEAVTVIAPNFKSRYSGVTSTIIALVPVQRQSVKIAVTGRGLPDNLPRLPVRALPRLLRSRPVGVPFRIWHARRNVEMVGGLVLKWVFRAPIKVLFTSAAQRRHKPFTRWLIARMDGAIATTSAAASYLERPATVIRHGVDTQVYRPLRDEDRDGGTYTATRWIGCFGRIRPNKGTDLFVDAMINLLPAHPDAKVVILGRATPDQAEFDKSLRRKIEAAGLSDRFHILGEVTREEVIAWYRRLALYVAPQRWEGYGLTPLEAMASGVPVVATKAGAFPEIVTSDAFGRLVEADDGPALETAIAEMLGDPARLAAMGKPARNHVLDYFQLEQEAAAINAVYERLWSENA